MKRFPAILSDLGKTLTKVPALYSHLPLKLCDVMHFRTLVSQLSSAPWWHVDQKRHLTPLKCLNAGDKIFPEILHFPPCDLGRHFSIL